MRWLNTPLEVPRRLRAIVRARESSVIVLALIVGALAGLVIAAMGEAVALMHLTFFGLDPGERLSGRVSLNPLYALLTPCLGFPPPPPPARGACRPPRPPPPAAAGGVRGSPRSKPMHCTAAACRYA